GRHARGPAEVSDRDRERPDPATEVVDPVADPHVLGDPGVLTREARREVRSLDIDLQLDPVLLVTGPPRAGTGNPLDLPASFGPVDPVVEPHEPGARDELEKRLPHGLLSGFERVGEPNQDHVADDVERPGKRLLLFVGPGEQVRVSGRSLLRGRSELSLDYLAPGRGNPRRALEERQDQEVAFMPDLEVRPEPSGVHKVPSDLLPPGSGHEETRGDHFAEVGGWKRRRSTSAPVQVPREPWNAAVSPNFAGPPLPTAVTPAPESSNGTGSSEWPLRMHGVAWSAVTANRTRERSRPSRNGPKNDRSIASTISRFRGALPSWPGSSGPLRCTYTNGVRASSSRVTLARSR